MMSSLNKIELGDQKYQTNVNVRDENYIGKFLFTIKDCVSLETYRQSIYFMSTIFLKEKIDGVRVLKFQLVCICNTTHPSQKHLVELCCEVHYMWWGNQEL